MVVSEESGVIVILDALGTKGKWNNPGEVKNYIESWERLTEEWQKILHKQGRKRDNSTRLNAFSDTIIMKQTTGDIAIDITAASHNISIIMLDAISKGIFFRGCISVGKVFSSDKMIIGPAIDEAAQYYTMPDWIGISASPSAYIVINNLRANNKLSAQDLSLFVNYDIPLKNSIERNGISIDYLSRLYLGWGEDWYKTEFGFSTPKEVVNIFKKELEKTTEISASLKIRNSIEYIESRYSKL